MVALVIKLATITLPKTDVQKYSQETLQVDFLPTFIIYCMSLAPPVNLQSKVSVMAKSMKKTEVLIVNAQKVLIFHCQDLIENLGKNAG